MRSWRRAVPTALVVLVAAIYVLLGHLDYWPAKIHGGTASWDLETPKLTSGDEPHYVMIVNSLLFDHDIRLDDDFARIRQGGYEAGFHARHMKFSGHTLLVNPHTGQKVLCVIECTPEDVAKLGAPRDELFQVPSHPIGYPLFMALVLFPLRPSPPDVEPLIGFLSIVVAFSGVLLTYVAALRSGLARGPALAAAALLGFASSWIVYLRAYFADPSIGLFVLLGYVALRNRRFVLAGMAVGVAILMKPVFVMIGFGWIAERIWARARRDALVLTASVGTSGLAVVVTNMILIRAPLAPGALPVGLANGLQSLYETFLDPLHGLWMFVPWSVIPFFWGAVAARPGASDVPGRVSVDARRQMMLALLLCVAVFASVGFGPGWCYGPRYYIPLLPFLSIITVDFAVSGRAWRKAVVGVLAAVAAVVAVPSVPQYHWLFMKQPFADITGP